MSALLELAKRCEAATGPDKALDLEIFKALGAPVPFQFANKLVALSFDEAEQCYFAPIGDMRVRYTPPEVTASVDAALTLVPEGWTAFEMRSHAARTRFSCDLSRLTECDASKEDWAHGRGKTLALAICAAALRARAAMEPKRSFVVEQAGRAGRQHRSGQ